MVQLYFTFFTSRIETAMNYSNRTFDLESWKVPKQYIHDGIIYSENIDCYQSLDDIKDWTPKEGDVIIASYPKTGRAAFGCLLNLS